MKNLLKSVQFKRKCSFVLIGVSAVSSLYLMYYKGRTDEIEELCNLAHNNEGVIALDFKLKDGVKTLIIRED